MSNMMKPFRRQRCGQAVALCAAAALLTLATSTAQADSAAPQSGDTTPGPAAMAFDLALGRPVGLAATALGTAVFVLGLPFEAMSGDVSGPARRLVVEPAKFTFTRPLGVMEGS